MSRDTRVVPDSKPKLPFELLIKILIHIDGPTIPICMRVCHAFFDILGERLYRTLTITKYHVDFPWEYLDADSVTCQSPISKKQLLGKVRTLVWNLHGLLSPYDSPMPWVTNLETICVDSNSLQLAPRVSSKQSQPVDVVVRECHGTRRTTNWYKWDVRGLAGKGAMVHYKKLDPTQPVSPSVWVGAGLPLILALANDAVKVGCDEMTLVMELHFGASEINEILEKISSHISARLIGLSAGARPLKSLRLLLVSHDVAYRGTGEDDHIGRTIRAFTLRRFLAHFCHLWGREVMMPTVSIGTIHDILKERWRHAFTDEELELWKKNAVPIQEKTWNLSSIVLHQKAGSSFMHDL